MAHFDVALADPPGAVATGDVSRGPIGLVVTRVEVRAPASAGVTQKLLRDLPLNEVLQGLRTERVLELPVRAVPAHPTSGRTQITDELLREVAVNYLIETAPGKDRRAIQRLSQHFKRTEGTVRAWVARARQEGWLGQG